MIYRNPWVYVEITCIKCAGTISNGHVRTAGAFAGIRKSLMEEAKIKGATLDTKTGEVTCIRCLTPMSVWGNG